MEHHTGAQHQGHFYESAPEVAEKPPGVDHTGGYGAHQQQQQQYANTGAYNGAGNNGYIPATPTPAATTSRASSGGAKGVLLLALIGLSALLLAAVVGLAAGLGVSQKNLHNAQADLQRAQAS